MTPSLLDHFKAAVPADFVATAMAATGESESRVGQMLAGALPLLAAALPGAAPAGLDALLADDPPVDDLLRLLFGADVDPLARSLAGSARSTRTAALALLGLITPCLARGARNAMTNQPLDTAALLALAAVGRGVALAALPPQLTVVLASFPTLARYITPPRAAKRRKQENGSNNWMLALVRRMNGNRAPAPSADQSLRK
jgi:hypothetical protein